MALGVSTEIARTSLSTLQERSSLISRNVANSGNELATRKIARVTYAPGGSARLASVTRAMDAALFNKVLVSNSAVGGQQEVVRALDRLSQTIADPEQDFSPAALVSKLGDALQQYSAGPQDPIRANAVLDAAHDLANGLGTATDTVQDVRTSADAALARGVAELNGYLADIETLNTEIVKGTFLGQDVTDQLDLRDNLVSKVATEIGIRVVARADNDIAIYTDSGVTLFDNSARSVSFDQTLLYDATISGNPLVVDGVAVTGPSASMAIGSGRLKGLTEVRDTIAVTYQSQLDEIARGLVEAFAETDQSGGGLPTLTGMFTYDITDIPSSGTILAGLAARIVVAAAVDPNRGGELNRIRDGGINGASYVYNSAGGAGFSDRIRTLADELDAMRAFDPAAEAGSSDSIADFAATSAGWLSELRRSTEGDLEFNETVQTRATEAFTEVAGVNLDLEMALLLDIERSYQATARLISTIDDMYRYILEAA